MGELGGFRDARRGVAGAAGGRARDVVGSPSAAGRRAPGAVVDGASLFDVAGARRRMVLAGAGGAGVDALAAADSATVLRLRGSFG